MRACMTSYAVSRHALNLPQIGPARCENRYPRHGLIFQGRKGKPQQSCGRPQWPLGFSPTSPLQRTFMLPVVSHGDVVASQSFLLAGRWQKPSVPLH